jgi:hypothetical protein
MPLSTWREDLRKPVNALSIGIGVIGLVFAIATWIISHQVAALSVKIVQIPVFDSQQAISVITRPDGGSIRMPVTVLDGSGKPIDTNIYAAEVAVWNSGDFELGQTKIRRPLVIAMGGTAKILDAGISRVTEPADDISALVDSSHTVTVTWHYFDPGDGFRIRVLYTSDKQEALDLSTNILGVHSITNVDTFGKGWTLSNILLGTMMALLVLIPALSIERIVGALERRLVRHQVRQSIRLLILLPASVAGLLLMIVGFYYWIFVAFRPSQPPI